MNSFFFNSKRINFLFLAIVSCLLIFFLFQTKELKQKIEANIFKVSTVDVLSIVSNTAKSLVKDLSKSDDFVKDIQSNTLLRKKIEEKLEVLITKNIQYAYILYKDNEGIFRFLADGSKTENKAFLNQKFDVDSRVWLDVYVEKKEILINHEILKTLSLTYIIPLLHNNEVELLMVIDFSLKKVENINSIIYFMQNGIIGILVVFLFLLVIVVLQMLKYNKVKKTAYIDHLTNVYNKNYLLKNQNNINLKHYSLSVLDIDHFKNVNDTYGHSVGDIILKKTAQIVSRTLRISNDDIVIRYGGEEFIIFIKKSKDYPDISLEVLNRILENIANHSFLISELKSINITVSIGINLNPANSNNLFEAFELADQALYTAKNSGRNNIQIYQEKQNVTC